MADTDKFDPTAHEQICFQRAKEFVAGQVPRGLAVDSFKEYFNIPKEYVAPLVANVAIDLYRRCVTTDNTKSNVQPAPVPLATPNAGGKQRSQATLEK